MALDIQKLQVHNDFVSMSFFGMDGMGPRFHSG